MTEAALHIEAGTKAKAYLKVCVIGSVYPRHESDTEVPWLRETIRRCRDAGIDIEVLAPSYRGLKSHYIDGVKVRRFRYAPAFFEDLTGEEGAPSKIHKFRYKVLTLLYILSGTVHLLFFHALRRYHILHVHWPFPHGIFSLVAKGLFGGKVVLNFHGACLLLARKYGFVNSFLKLFIKKADQVITNSSFTASRVRAVYPRDSVVIPYGTTFDPLQSSKRKVGKPLVLSVGRLIERKGFSYLVDAAREVVKKIPDAQFAIVGGGPLLEPLRQQVRNLGLEKNFTVAGKVSQETLVDYYRRASLFVLPSIEDAKGDTEGLGVVLIEALSCRIPVVASNVGGIPDVVIDGETGLLFPQKDSTAAAEAILKVLKDDKLRMRLTNNGYQHVCANFSWESVVKRIADVYKDLASKG
ncbi:MAG: glycosyltransferase family 4 protein [Chitinispirillaceae bacterium]